MYTADIEIINKKLKLETTAIIDTGFTGGLWLPIDLANELKATLVKPVRLPRTIDGKTIRGLATALTARLPDAEWEDLVPVFVPNADTDEVLIGAYMLSVAEAKIVIGEAEYTAPLKFKANRTAQFDFGDWIVPTHRPVTKWW